MKPIMNQVREILESCSVNDTCKECIKHGRQFDVGCETCVLAQKERVSNSLMYLTYH